MAFSWYSGVGFKLYFVIVRRQVTHYHNNTGTATLEIWNQKLGDSLGYLCWWTSASHMPVVVTRDWSPPAILSFNFLNRVMIELAVIET
jgi:hypothetical protein